MIARFGAQLGADLIDATRMMLAAATDPTVLVGAMGAVAVVASGLITLIGVRYTVRQSRAAAETSSRLETTKVSQDAYAAAEQTWQRHVDSLKVQVSDLLGRVGTLEQQRDRDAELIRRLHRENREVAAYARDLLRILAHHEIAYPPPPMDL